MIKNLLLTKLCMLSGLMNSKKYIICFNKFYLKEVILLLKIFCAYRKTSETHHSRFSPNESQGSSPVLKRERGGGHPWLAKSIANFYILWSRFASFPFFARKTITPDVVLHWWKRQLIFFQHIAMASDLWRWGRIERIK